MALSLEALMHLAAAERERIVDDSCGAARTWSGCSV
jgi:hypothetical protein